MARRCNLLKPSELENYAPKLPEVIFYGWLGASYREVRKSAQKQLLLEENAEARPKTVNLFLDQCSVVNSLAPDKLIAGGTKECLEKFSTKFVHDSILCSKKSAAPEEARR